MELDDVSQGESPQDQALDTPILRNQEEQKPVKGVENNGQGGMKEIRRLSYHRHQD